MGLRDAVAVAAFVLAVSGLPAPAVQPDEVLRDTRLETRARAISGELRCLVCQNQSIDDSDAPLARDLRILVRERLKAGDRDDEVRTFVVRRYGEFVLLRPVVGWHTALLWLGPALLVAVAAAAILARARRGRDPAAEPPLSPDEERRIAALAAGKPPGG